MAPLTTLAAGSLRLDLCPSVGGSIARFQAAGVDLMRPAPAGYDDALDAACFPLVPFSNRVREGRFVFRGRAVTLADNMPGQRHPLHGQGWRSAWTVVEAGAASARLAFSHAPGDWPWAYEAEQVFALDETGLTVRLSVRNQADQPQPCGLGLHPYFPCDGDTRLDAPVDGVWTIDDEIMPVERRPAAGRYDLRDRAICGADLDNGYDGWGGRARLVWPGRGLGLDIIAPDARYFQVYAPAAGGVVVAEPVTHANAALSLDEGAAVAAGITILSPGATFTLATRFEVKILNPSSPARSGA